MSDFVGYCLVEVTDEVLGLTFPVAVLYPSNTPGQPEHISPYTLDVARDAPVEEGRHQLVLISHGTGGSGLVYRTLAHHLARHGFVVGLPEHPFNNRNDNSWANTPQNLEARPRHLQLAIDALLAHPLFAGAIRPDAVGLIGHSMGGYTALALAGGKPTSAPQSRDDWQPQPIPVPYDERVKALVLLAPATPWYLAPGALSQVRVPMLLLTAEKDEHTTPEHAQTVLAGVPDPGLITHRVVPNAGHYSFLSPFPAARVSLTFPPSQDPPGFDRGQFQQELNAEVLAFLQREL